jgi:aminoglycoside phosphotransferase (APT) family kinase protein
MADQPVPQGIDAGPVGAWLAANVPGATPPFEYSLISGGHSNFTYRVTAGGGQAYALRRPPPGKLLATAHDVAREWRIIAALAPTPVPVAPALALCEDESVNGSPFAVTAFVDGVVMYTAEFASQFDEAASHEMSWHLMDVLADLHAVDIDAVGLGELSRREGYLERQLKRWTRQWEGSKMRELPVIDEVASRLAQDMPTQQTVALVHGDYRFGNCIVDPVKLEVAAVLDWELCALGDPLMDLGHLSVFWRDEGRPPQNDPSWNGRFPSYEELVQRYAARSTLDLSRLGYYRAFAAWRLAIIGEGVAARERARGDASREAARAGYDGVAALAEFALRCLA